MNRNSNTYTVIYASVMVIIVAAVLAFTAISLRPIQHKNVAIDKKIQILNSVNIAATSVDAEKLYNEYIKKSYVINSKGEEIPEVDAFQLEIANEVKKAEDARELPVYVAQMKDGSNKYVLPMYGMGLWGPVWGYVAVDSDGNTIYGAVFAHQGETPGLGAEITTSAFIDQFKGKHLYRDGKFTSIAVEKLGIENKEQDQVDAISGGTITSKAVQSMMWNCLSPYQNFLQKLKAGN